MICSTVVDATSTVGDTTSTLDSVLSCGECYIVQHRIFRTAEDIQNCGGYSVLWRETISSVGDTINTVEGNHTYFRYYIPRACCFPYCIPNSTEHPSQCWTTFIVFHRCFPRVRKQYVQSWNEGAFRPPPAISSSSRDEYFSPGWQHFPQQPQNLPQHPGQHRGTQIQQSQQKSNRMARMRRRIRIHHGNEVLIGGITPTVVFVQLDDFWSVTLITWLKEFRLTWLSNWSCD